MALSFETPLDIARRACQHLGERMITSFQDTDSVAAVEFNESYKRLVEFELERAVWTFSIRAVIARPVTGSTFLWTPPTYSGAATYSAGNVVAFTSVAGDIRFPVTGARPILYQTDIPLTAAASGNPDASFDWRRYGGNISGDVYDKTQSYFGGELVIVPATYDGGTTYALNDIVTGPDGLYYVSLAAANTGNTPATSATWWQLYTTWIGTSTNQWPNYVTGYAIYMSLTNANTSAPPGAQWQTAAGTVANLRVFYPLGTGPTSDTSTLNILRLPYGYLRPAPRYLWNDDYPYLGADIAQNYDDWVIQGQYALTRYLTAQLIRFASTSVTVPDMHSMFCEMLAARMAYEGCERITGSADKKKEVLAAYEYFGNQARLVNAVLMGMPKQPLTDYIAVRQ
jgi:hypothetical protein